MTKYIDEHTAKQWQDIADKYRQASNLLSDIHLKLVIDMDAPPAAVAIVVSLIDDIAGQAYMHTPQSEWTGGDSFKIRAPHAVN